MAKLLNEIPWAEPIVPVAPDPDWEAEVKRRTGTVSDLYRRVAPLPWLRRACLEVETATLTHLPMRLAHIGTLVTAQENGCRYCYGASRAYMRLLGYSEALIGRIEREAQLAELDEKERAFVNFCRNLARSKPRPAKAEVDGLVELGFAPLAAAEMAFFIAGNCFFNRVTTFVACPPEEAFERFMGGFTGRIVSLAGPVLRWMEGRKHRAATQEHQAAPVRRGGAFAPLVDALGGLPAAAVFGDIIEEAFASPVLSVQTKALMFAVVGRTLECNFCQREPRKLLQQEGFSEGEIDQCLAVLGSPRLEPFESAILAWTRNTVHYEPQAIQEQTRALGEQIGEARLLEAVGVAALANGTVRLAMLLE